MAEKIKGLNIVLSGDTSGLDKALKKVNVNAGRLQGELKAVERGLKLDPGNVELLSQKQKILAEAVENTSDKLKQLEDAQAEVNEQFKKGTIDEKQYRAFNREVEKTKAELSDLEDKLQESTSKFKKFGDAAKKAADNVKSVGDKTKDIGGKLSAAITAPIIGGATAAVESTRELRDDLAKLDTNAQASGNSIEGTRQALKGLNQISEETDSNIEALSNLMASGFNDNQMQRAVDELSGAVLRFPDTLKIEGLADGLQETLATGAATGSFGELLERMGVNLDDFNAGLADAKKNGTEAEYALAQLEKLNLSDVTESFRESNKELIAAKDAQFDMANAWAEIGATLEPIMTRIKEVITDLMNRFNELSPASQNMVLIFAAIAAAIGPALVIIGTLISSVGTIIGLFATGGAMAGVLSGAITALGAVFTFLTGPLGAVILAVGAVIAIWKLMGGNMEDLKAKIKSAGESIANTFTNIRNVISEKINSAKDAVKRAIDAIKGFFNFEWKLPKIKLPHFSIKGKFSLSPPSVPKLNVDWYKTGGIFNNPSVIGVGEAGPEAVIPISKLSGILADTLGQMGGSGGKLEHSGVIRVEGINNKGELTAVMPLLAREMRIDQSRYSNVASTRRIFR